jgi:hypothetical protein
MKHIINEPHECGWGIGESEGHDKPFKETKLGFECGLLSFF